MSKRSITALLVSAFGCAILNAEDLPLIHQPRLTPQDSGTINGLIAVWPVNPTGGLGLRSEAVHSQLPLTAGRLGMPGCARCRGFGIPRCAGLQCERCVSDVAFMLLC